MLGERIKEAREKKGYSQADLADLVFITKQSISKYENNKSIPTKQVLEKLEEVLEVKLMKPERKLKFRAETGVIGVLLIVIVILVSTIVTQNNKLNDYEYLTRQTFYENDDVIVSYIDSEASEGDFAVWVKLSFQVKDKSSETTETEVFDVSSLSLTNGRIKNQHYSIELNRPLDGVYGHLSEIVSENRTLIIWVEFEITGDTEDVKAVLDNETALTYNGNIVSIIKPKTQ